MNPVCPRKLLTKTKMKILYCYYYCTINLTGYLVDDKMW